MLLSVGALASGSVNFTTDVCIHFGVSFLVNDRLIFISGRNRELLSALIQAFDLLRVGAWTSGK